MATGPKPCGFIIVWKTEGRGVLVLTSGGEGTLAHWILRGRLEECCVHSEESVRRAIKEEQAWTNRAMFAYRAVYNPETEEAEPEEGAIPFNLLADQMLGKSTSVGAVSNEGSAEWERNLAS